MNFFYKFSSGYGLTIFKYRHITRPYPLAATQFHSTFLQEKMQKFLFFSYFKNVKSNKGIGRDFIIDKLTNSIGNVLTRDSFTTDISILKSTI